MKKLLLFLVLFSACQTIEPPKTEAPITEAEKQIAKDLIQGIFDDVWAGLDSTKISHYHTDDFLLLENGELWKNEEIKVYVRRQLAKNEAIKRVNKMEYLTIEKYGESMQIVYHNFADFIQADTIVYKGRWLESALAVPTEEGWRLKMMHSTWVRE